MSVQSPTILSSPFAQSEILLRLARQATEAPDFPRAKLEHLLRETPTFSSSFEDNNNDQNELDCSQTQNPQINSSDIHPLPSLNDREIRASREAVEAVSLYLASLQGDPISLRSGSSFEKEGIKRGSGNSGFPGREQIQSRLEEIGYRVNLGGCLLLLRELTRAETELDVVRGSLRSLMVSSKKKKPVKDTLDENQQSRISLLMNQVYVALELTARLQGKYGNADRFRRWRVEISTQ